MPLGYALTASQVVQYYAEREDVQRALLAYGVGRRAVVGTDPGVFGRHDLQASLTSPAQIAAWAKSALDGRISAVPRKYPAFHATITRSAANADPSLCGTDLVIEVDVKPNHKDAFRQGRKVLDLLDSYGVPYRVKFSGNSSPHIILPAELFPPDIRGHRFGGAARKMLDFIAARSGAAGIDASFASPDHFLRMPYSLNEHTGLVSVPIPKDQYNDFRLEMAEAHNVVVDDSWMDVSNEPRDGVKAFLAAALAFGGR